MNIGIFGPKLSGKTTLARAWCEAQFLKNGKLTLALDIHGDGGWKGNVRATADSAEFWKWVYGSRDKIILVDEAAATIARDRTLVPLFTALRHRGHWLVVIGHSGMDLLPVMRQNLDEIFLFRQPASAAAVWCEVFAEESLMECTELKQFEFLHHQMFKKPLRQKLKL